MAYNLWNIIKMIFGNKRDSLKIGKMEDKVTKSNNFAFQLRNVIIDGDHKYFRLKERVDP